jgi:hypothetical protein
MTDSNRQRLPLYTELFPIITRPSLIARAVFEAKAITQAPEAMIFLTAISAVSVASQGLINVKLPTGKVCPTAIWGLTVAGSGERKSTAWNIFMKGIKSFQKARAEIHKKELDIYDIKSELYEKKKANQKLNRFR